MESDKTIGTSLDSLYTASKKTLAYYDTMAQAFTQDTRDAKMGPLQEKFLALLPAGGRILDFGCGTGRDTRLFLKAGFHVDALDGSSALCKAATLYTGIPVKHMLFQDFHAINHYDGIWACASLLHLPPMELSPVLHHLAEALHDNGILYLSFKYGNFSGFRHGRYFTDFTEASILPY